MLAEAADLVVLGERGAFRPPGVLGGGPAPLNRVTYDTADGPARPEMAAKLFGASLARGQRVRIESPGGGGFGPPEERAAQAIERDRVLGYMTEDGIARDYGGRT